MFQQQLRAKQLIARSRNISLELRFSGRAERVLAVAIYCGARRKKGWCCAVNKINKISAKQGEYIYPTDDTDVHGNKEDFNNKNCKKLNQKLPKIYSLLLTIKEK